ncbi:sigma-54-dependent transcriptional regulator [Denitrificimonas caeni]|uniref:sigma-54-dependent transcriptional regulator n=1 Tax=Denitrificimonas caeni TaxID=521720 RepID=UPI0003B69866|nr:sigma-54 dependent transcriptional regulator [Denitrificimonas caeni]
MTIPTALIIDDEPDIRELLEITLGRMNLQTRSACNVKEAYQWLAREPFALCLTDMRLPDGTGLDIIEFVQKNYSQMPIAMITAYGCVETATHALKAGAFDFITKPVDLVRLRELVNSALRLREPNVPAQITEGPLLGQSRPMQKLREKIDKLARSQAPVYISGESGSGKELVARQIHLQSARAKQPFIPVNCGAIPAELMESEFFGHKKGSFTGASEDKPGLFQAAHGGTLFLDEVADLPLSMQVKLLRALQEKAIRPVGSQQEQVVDVRILSATHKNLANEVAAERFRQDLYYRLNVIELAVPPLRERPEDIGLLSESILQRLSAGGPPVHLHAEALNKLQGYRFSGNVRELENMLERAYTLAEGEFIHADDLQFQQAVLHKTSDNSVANAAPEPAAMPAAQPRERVDNLEDHLEDIERKLITQALEETRWNRTAAAERLGLSFRSLRYRLKKLGID